MLKLKILASANLKGNKRSNIIMGFMILLVISLILISSYSITISNAVNEFKNDVRARMVTLSPCENGILTDDVIQKILNVDHVESVSTLQGMRSQLCNVISISGENEKYNTLKEQAPDCNSHLSMWSLIGKENMDVIAGDTLDNSPTFSCIIPNLFYPFEFNETDENLDYIDGESMLGKTITVKPFGDNFETLYNVDPEISPYTNEWLYLPALEYKLKVVGVYYSSPTAKGYYDMIYVSEETGKQILNQAMEASSIDLTDETSLVAKWWNTPGLRTHYLVVDDYDNLEETCNALNKNGISIDSRPQLGIKESTIIAGNIFRIVSVLLTASSALLCIINLIQSTLLSLYERKGEIGLLKAVGYKNKHIFASMLLEQLMMTAKGCTAGAVISAAVIFITNLIFSHSTYVNRLYIIDWKCYFILLAISVLITFIVPLICQLMGLKRLSKIQPREAMNSK